MLSHACMAACYLQTVDHGVQAIQIDCSAKRVMEHIGRQQVGRTHIYNCSSAAALLGRPMLCCAVTPPYCAGPCCTVLCCALLQVVDGPNDDLRRDALDTICALAVALGQDFNIFVPTICKVGSP